MKISVSILTLLAACSLPTLPVRAQYDMPPAPDQGAAPQNDPNAPQGQQAPPPPDQQYAPDQQGQGPGPGYQNGPDQNAPDQGAPDQPASFQTFYDNLAQQGTWVQSSDYGYVWQPAVNDPSWAPYTDGNWVYSDAGWTWNSNEPWGWATYHYGRWVNLDGSGWCWIPGYTWAPAWVSWRYGDGYCGWAPLPPDSFVGIDYGGPGISVGIGFHIGGDCDSYYGIGAGWYRFVPVSYIGYRNYRGHYVNPHDNYTIINHTTNVTNLNVNGNRGNGGPRNFNNVTTGGPSFAQVNAASQTPVQRVRLTSAAQPGQARLANNSLAVFAPHMTSTTATPPHVGGSLSSATINRGVDVTRPLAVNRSLAGTVPTQNQIQQAQLAQRNAPAHVITASTPVHSPLQAPLTSLRPMTTASTSQIQGGTVNPQHNNAPSNFNGNNTARVQPAAPATTAPVMHNSVNGYNGSYPVNTPHTSGPQVNPFMHPVTSTQAQPSNISGGGSSSRAPNPYVQQQHQTTAAPSVNVHPQPQAAQQQVSAPTRQPQAQAQIQSQSAQATQQNNSYPQNNSFQPQAQPQPQNNSNGGYHNPSGGNGWGNHNQQQNH